jgi:hypothetical protein
MEDAELGGAPYHIHGGCEASSIHVGHVIRYPDGHITGSCGAAPI